MIIEINGWSIEEIVQSNNSKSIILKRGRGVMPLDINNFLKRHTEGYSIARLPPSFGVTPLSEREIQHETE